MFEFIKNTWAIFILKTDGKLVLTLKVRSKETEYQSNINKNVFHLSSRPALEKFIDNFYDLFHVKCLIYEDNAKITEWQVI